LAGQFYPRPEISNYLVYRRLLDFLLEKEVCFRLGEKQGWKGKKPLSATKSLLLLEHASPPLQPSWWLKACGQQNIHDDISTIQSLAKSDLSCLHQNTTSAIFGAETLHDYHPAYCITRYLNSLAQILIAHFPRTVPEFLSVMSGRCTA
jgi:hypothetical protein